MSSAKEASPTLVSDRLNFFLGDRFAEWLIVRLHWSPAFTALAAAGLLIIANLLMALVVGTVVSTPARRGLLNDGGFWILDFVVVPIIFGYYVWLCQAPEHVVDKLEDSGVLVPGEQDVRDASRLLASRWPTYLSLALSAVMAVLFFLMVLGTPPIWWNSSPLTSGLNVLLYIPIYFAAFSTIFRYIVTTRALGRLLRNVVLNPLHPDRAGGLRPLGQYALKTTYPITLLGIAAVLFEYWLYLGGEFSTAYVTHGIVILYFVLAPVVFFLPLWSAHGAMRRAKEDLLLGISRQFNQDFSRAYLEVASSSRTLRDNVEKVEQLQKLHDLASAFPVWPFDAQTIRRFLVTVLSPLLALLVTLLGEALTKLLFP